MSWLYRLFAAPNELHGLLTRHFRPHRLGKLTVHERKFPMRVQADLQRAIDDVMQSLKVHHFSSVQILQYSGRAGFANILNDDSRLCHGTIAPPQYEEIEIGTDEPVRSLKDGLWLLEEGGCRFAAMLAPPVEYDYLAQAAGTRFQIAVPPGASSLPLVQGLFDRLEKAIQAGRSYRGKVLSLEAATHYSGRLSGIRVHQLATVPRDQVILPRPTLELLERNVLRFVEQRPQLAKLGMATKKGLLFYGPPGTGKTHTIHYLAGALPGVTTLLITAEQVGLLSDYMELARLLQPSIVVIEDADLIARDRSDMTSPCQEAFLNKLLNEMDGLRADAEVLFILTTNRPEALEAALTSRPGRVDQAIEFPLPDAEGREKLIRLYGRSAPLTENIVRATVKLTDNVSAAFIKELMRRAAQFHLERGGGDSLMLHDVDSALEEMLFQGGSLNRKLLGGYREGDEA